MDDDKQDKAGALPGDGAKRAPPTIELTASDVTDTPRAPDASATGEARATGEESTAEGAQTAADDRPGPERAEEARPTPAGPSLSTSFLASAATGALAALLAVGVAHLTGWPGAPVPAVTNAPDKADVEALGVRVAKIEADAARPAAPPASDPAVRARLDAVEKTLASLREDVTAARAQSEKAVAALADIKPAPAATEAAPPVDLSGIEDRLGKLERTAAALSAAAATPAPPPPPVEDPKLRAIAVASLLESAVMQGEPYAQALTAARAATDDADVLKPLDAFAATGVPSAAALSRELLALLPKLAPKQDAAAAPSGIVERLQQSAAKLVRVERTDAPGNAGAAAIARVTAAAQRNDLAEARRELGRLPDDERAPVQGWIAKVDAREAALAASRRFAAQTMNALSKPAR